MIRYLKLIRESILSVNFQSPGYSHCQAVITLSEASYNLILILFILQKVIIINQYLDVWHGSSITVHTVL